MLGKARLDTQHPLPAGAVMGGQGREPVLLTRCWCCAVTSKVRIGKQHPLLAGGVVDGRMGGRGSEPVLRDTLLVLCCDDIKLASLKARPEEDQATSQEEQAQIAGMAIKKTIISQVQAMI